MEKWYFKTWFIVLLFILGIWLIFPGIIAVVLLILRYSQSRKNMQKDEDKRAVEKTGKADDESSKNYELFDDVVDENVLKYKYEDNICLHDNAIELISGNGGKELKFVQEPENEFDKNAISIYFENKKIGYVHKGKIQDMLNDWIKRNELYIGYINKIFKNENKATYKIGFYKPLECFETATFSLVKTNKKIDDYSKRIDNLSCMSAKEPIQIEYDEECDAYVVYNENYEEIGELPNSACDFIESDRTVGVVKELTETDDGKIKAKVIVLKNQL